MLDNGQYVEYSVVLSANTQNSFTVNLLENGYVINSLTGQSKGTINFGSFVPSLGYDIFYVIATDTKLSKNNVFSSDINTILVYPKLGSQTITIEQNPTTTSNYWGACVAWTNPNGVQQPQICAGSGVPAASISVPYGSKVDYVCTADWYGGSYAFVNWSGSYNGPGCVTQGSISIPVSGIYTIEGNYKLS